MGNQEILTKNVCDLFNVVNNQLQYKDRIIYNLTIQIQCNKYNNDVNRSLPAQSMFSNINRNDNYQIAANNNSEQQSDQIVDVETIDDGSCTKSKKASQKEPRKQPVRKVTVNKAPVQNEEAMIEHLAGPPMNIIKNNASANMQNGTNMNNELPVINQQPISLVKNCPSEVYLAENCNKRKSATEKKCYNKKQKMNPKQIPINVSNEEDTNVMDDKQESTISNKQKVAQCYQQTEATGSCMKINSLIADTKVPMLVLLNKEQNEVQMLENSCKKRLPVTTETYLNKKKKLNPARIPSKLLKKQTKLIDDKQIEAEVIPNSVKTGIGKRLDVEDSKQ